jgi:hypothetical protein
VRMGSSFISGSMLMSSLIMLGYLIATLLPCLSTQRPSSPLLMLLGHRMLRSIGPSSAPYSTSLILARSCIMLFSRCASICTRLVILTGLWWNGFYATSTVLWTLVWHSTPLPPRTSSPTLMPTGLAVLTPGALLLGIVSILDHHSSLGRPSDSPPSFTPVPRLRIGMCPMLLPSARGFVSFFLSSLARG